MKTILSVILMLLTVTSCAKKSIDFTKEENEILKLHNTQRGYHFNKDSVTFANQLSNDYIGVNRGLITMPKKEETISKYNSYFSVVEFVKWDDVTEPIVKFSDDGSMAYTIVDKIVTVIYKDQTGNKVEEKTHFAWTAIYKKHGEQWKIDCVTSTEKPADIEN